MPNETRYSLLIVTLKGPVFIRQTAVHQRPAQWQQESLPALREKFTANTDPAWDPHVLKALIQRTASPVNQIGFSYDLGFGIVNGTNVLNGFP